MADSMNSRSAILDLKARMSRDMTGARRSNPHASLRGLTEEVRDPILNGETERLEKILFESPDQHEQPTTWNGPQLLRRVVRARAHRATSKNKQGALRTLDSLNPTLKETLFKEEVGS